MSDKDRILTALQNVLNQCPDIVCVKGETRDYHFFAEKNDALSSKADPDPQDLPRAR